MSETTPRELIPESIMTPELPAESEAVSAVRREKEALEQDAKDALNAVRNLDPSATDEEVTEAMDARKAAQERLSSFQDMWADYGGQAVDDAQEAVAKASTDPTSTTYNRAIARLTAAEDAFYSRVQAERNAIYEDAYKENDAFNAEVDAAIAASPALTEMNDLALKISHLRHDAPNPRTAPRDALRLVEYQDKLEELQEAFLRSDEFDTRYANEIANRSLRPPVETAADTAPKGSKLDDDKEDDTKKPDVDPTDSKLDDEEDDDTTKPDVDPKDSKLDSEDDELDSSDKDVEPKDSKLDTEDDEEDDDTKKPDVDPKDSKLDSEDDEEDADKDVDAKDSKLDSEDDEEDEPEVEKKKWYKRFGARVYKIFTYETEDGERKFSGRRLAIATGGVAVLGALLYFSLRSGTDNSHLMPKGGPKGGGSPIDAAPVVPVSPTEVVPSVDLPPSTGFEYPWDWAVKAFGKAEAMDTLRELAGKAVEDGKDVQITGSGTHQVISVNGNTNTEYVVNALRGYYTK